MKFYRIKNDSERKTLYVAAGIKDPINFTYPYFVISNGVGDFSQHNGLGIATHIDTLEEALSYLNPFLAYCVCKSMYSKNKLQFAIKNSRRRIDKAALSANLNYDYFVSDDQQGLGAGFSDHKIGRAISLGAMIKWLEEGPSLVNTSPLYDVVCCSELKYLSEEINRRMLTGWLPQGGISYCPSKGFIQAIVLP